MNRRTIAVLLMGLLAFAGCGSDDNPTDSGNTGGTGTAVTGTLTHLGGSTWQAGGSLGSGSISVTTSTATRVAGTFSFTAPRISGTEAPAILVVTNGVFDAEIQP